MPDSLQPPNWGPAPFDDRDLDAVLSGQQGDIPAALRPVAETIAALRAAPTRAELSGEPAIMAEFRAQAGLADTRELPLLSAERSPRRKARHRARRQGAPPLSRRTGALMGAAAAVLIVVAVAFASNLPGPIKRMTHLGHESTVSPSLQGTGSPYRGTTKAKPSDSPAAVVSSSSPSPTSSPSPSPSASGLCQSYFGYFTHPESEDSWAAEMSLYWRLTKLAGSSDPSRVFRYCSPYLGDKSGHGWHYQGMYHWEQGNAGQDSQPATGAASEAPQGHSGPGSGSAQSAQGSQNGTGSGQGSQNGGPAAQDPSPVSSPAP